MGDTTSVEEFWEKRHEDGYRIGEGPLQSFTDFLACYKSELKGKQGLDIGCGNGRNLLAAAHQCEMSGVDLNAEALRQAKTRLVEKEESAFLAQGDCTQLPFGDEQFDFAYSCQAYQYAGGWEEIEKCFAEAARVLKKGGLFSSAYLPKKKIAA